ncbi:MAG TPA: HAMP domain-containing sensor histidine kinase [Candidatus Limnocylindrales bacterium]|nr:HAMP domain-containing sensor histidine kinase [Candidatus Limnocylindrales bacterium]
MSSPDPRTSPTESFVDEMKRYLHLLPADATILRELGPLMEKYLPEMAERFYAQIPHHPGASRVFTGGEAQVQRLKSTLQAWGRGLFNGVYDEHYAEDRFLIGFRHVRISLDQKYVISAMGVVRSFLMEKLFDEFPAREERLAFSQALGKILDLDLNLMCDSYFRATMAHLHTLNQELEHAGAQLVEANAIKDEFLAQVSHDLRTPLNSILSFSKMVLDGLCSSPQEEKEVLRDVFSSGQLLLRLVNDLLDISSIEAGKLALDLEKLEPREVLDSTLPLVAVQAASKSLRLIDETLEQSLPAVWSDEIRFRQVLMNLLSNAVKFTANGYVRIRAIENLPAGRLRFEIEDTGIGVPIEKRNSVFEKFVRHDPKALRGIAGSGLGLAIAKRLVEMMNGEIGLETGPDGKGSIAWFTLPLAASQSKPEAKSA